jgi:hypothetical protein
MRKLDSRRHCEARSGEAIQLRASSESLQNHTGFSPFALSLSKGISTG